MTGIRGLAGINYSSLKDLPTTKRTMFGKPFTKTYIFAENRLMAHRRTLLGEVPTSESELKTVYMVGVIKRAVLLSRAMLKYDR